MLEYIGNIAQGVAVLLGVAAAITWIAASYDPAGGPGPTPYMPADRNHPLWGQIRAHGEKMRRGALLNKGAALLTGLAAFAALLSWLLSSNPNIPGSANEQHGGLFEKSVVRATSVVQ